VSDTIHPRKGETTGGKATDETFRHVLFCEEEGRVVTMNYTINLLNNWLRMVGTHKTLRLCLVEFARTRGTKPMENVVRSKGA
jgi:hypothetical protein